MEGSIIHLCQICTEDKILGPATNAYLMMVAFCQILCAGIVHLN